MFVGAIVPNIHQVDLSLPLCPSELSNIRGLASLSSNKLSLLFVIYKLATPQNKELIQIIR